MPGRPPLPIEQKIARRKPAEIPKYPMMPERVDGIPEPPPWMPELGVECWNSLVNILTMREQISAESYWSLSALCLCYTEWVELAQDIQRNGRTYSIEDRRGNVSYHTRPEVRMFNDADRRYRDWLTCFGLTDNSRHKVTMHQQNKPQENNTLAQWGLG